MSLRRTALTRRTELRRTPMPRKREAKATRAAQTIRRQRDTGPTAAVRLTVNWRAGWACEVCGLGLYDSVSMAWLHAHNHHHRRPRSMGGSTAADTNSPANLLLVCGSGTTGCHGEIESNRADSIEAGLLVLQGQDPATQPVELRRGLTILDHDGNYLEAP